MPNGTGAPSTATTTSPVPAANGRRNLATMLCPSSCPPGSYYITGLQTTTPTASNQNQNLPMYGENGCYLATSASGTSYRLKDPKSPWNTGQRLGRSVSNGRIHWYRDCSKCGYRGETRHDAIGCERPELCTSWKQIIARPSNNKRTMKIALCRAPYATCDVAQETKAIAGAPCTCAGSDCAVGRRLGYVRMHG